jgi:hypothetical protein
MVRNRIILGWVKEVRTTKPCVQGENFQGKYIVSIPYLFHFLYKAKDLSASSYSYM